MPNLREVLTTSQEVRKWLVICGGLLFLALIGSCFVESIRSRKEPKAPKKIEGEVDHGVVSPGPVNSSPEVVYVNVPAPKLTREQIVAEAKALGMQFPVKQSPPPPASETQDELEVVFPQLFAKESFGPGPAGDWITVWAWQMEEGARIDLMGKFADYQPPTPPPSKPCDDGGLVGNVAEWKFRILAGGVASPDGIGIGPVGGVRYEGFRLLGLTATVDVAGGWSEQSGPVVLGGLGVSF